MTSHSGSRQSVEVKGNKPAFGRLGNVLFERQNPGFGRSTPDSEVLASSDEETEQTKRTFESRKILSNRRTSILNEQKPDDRRQSFGASTNSQPNTPGVGHDTWTTLSPSMNAFNGSAYPFGQNIWGSSQSPVTRGSGAAGDSDRIHSALPHRSLSFSAGQRDSESNASGSLAANRPTQTLQRRTSRQSALGLDAGGLHRVNENDKLHLDANSTITSQPARHPVRATSHTASLPVNASFQNRARGLVGDSTELAVEEADDMTQLRYPIRNGGVRRMSDLNTAMPYRQPTGPSYSNSTFRVTRPAPHWSTVQEVDYLEAIPQSRRHSFADVPTRRGSLGSIDDPPPHSTNTTSAVNRSDDYRSENYLRHDETARSQTDQAQNRHLQHQQSPTQVQQAQQRTREHDQYAESTLYTSIPTYPPYYGPAKPPLYVVSFKLARSEIFYIAEGSGLTVQPGDLVSVEADRGNDVGCVQHTGLGWEEARRYKAKYAEQHFQWLMMFSAQTRKDAPNMVNPNSQGAGRGGTGPSGQGVLDIKPKLIKRHAQQHEFDLLQDKEGDEAKAKRICQSKVVEHNLNMEILDAEFQFDRKKLTFYFFSTEYINFNALVTELFKMYKTRIWMSAINPASYQSQVSALGITEISNHLGASHAGQASLGSIAVGVPTAEEGTGDARVSARYSGPDRGNRPMSNSYAEYYQPLSPPNPYSTHFHHLPSDPFTSYVPNFSPAVQMRSPPMAHNYQTLPHQQHFQGQYPSHYSTHQQFQPAQQGRAGRQMSGQHLAYNLGSMSLE